MRTKVWITKEQEHIRIMDMGDSHLLNAVNLLERYAKVQHSQVDYPCFNGEMAQYYAEQSFMEMMHTGPSYFLPDIYNDLVEEIQRRKLVWESSIA